MMQLSSAKALRLAHRSVRRPRVRQASLVSAVVARTNVFLEETNNQRPPLNPINGYRSSKLVLTSRNFHAACIGLEQNQTPERESSIGNDKSHPEEKTPTQFNPSLAIPSYEGEVVIVTGGTTGIGAATCIALSDAGAKAVYNLDIVPPEENDDTMNGIGFIRCDVSKPDELKAAINLVYEKEGRIDHLISNAGVWVGGEAMEDITEEEFDRVVGINTKGCFFAIAAVVPIMRKQSQGGSIVIVGSDQVFIGKPGQNLYGMTKGAIAQLAKSCAVQYAPENIRVNCVCPGTIDTPLMHKAVKHMADLAGDDDVEGRIKWLAHAQPFHRLGTPEEVAHTIGFVSKTPFMVGAMVQIDGGYSAV